MSQGYIKLHRKLQECWIWDSDEPFDRRSAWIDLLISANHSDNKMLFDGSLLVIKRGQFITSIRKLSTKWKWSSTKVTSFLDTLENDQMIKRESDTKKTLISIINYGLYQDNTSEKKTVKIHSEDTEVTQKNTNKNEEECIKNDNNIYANRFEEVWSHYPRKEDKGLAYKCYKARINDGYSEKELLEATIGYEKECRESNREKRYIKKGSTFYGVNTPFVDFIQKPKEKENSNYDFIFLGEHQTESPYYGFPKEWFNGDVLDESKVIPVIRPSIPEKGWYKEEEISAKELIEKYKTRRAYCESHSI